MGAEAVASYDITKKMFLYSQISSLLIIPLWPAFIEALAKKDYKWAKNTLVKILKISTLIGLLTSIPLVIFGKSIIEFWVNKDVIPSTLLLVGFFLLAVFNNYIGSMSSFLNNNELVKKQLKFWSLTTIMSMMFQIILCKIFGTPGVVFGILIAYAIFYVVPAYRLAFGFLKIEKNKYD